MGILEYRASALITRTSEPEKALGRMGSSTITVGALSCSARQLRTSSPLPAKSRKTQGASRLNISFSKFRCSRLRSPTSTLPICKFYMVLASKTPPTPQARKEKIRITAMGKSFRVVLMAGLLPGYWRSPFSEGEIYWALQERRRLPVQRLPPYLPEACWWSK